MNQARIAPGQRGQDDVVDGAAVHAADLAVVLERGAHEHDPPLGRGLEVERRLGRGAAVGELRGDRAGLGGSAPDAATERLRVAAQRAHGDPGMRADSATALRGQPGRRRLRGCDPVVAHELARPGVDVEQHLAEVDGRDAVDEDLVGLVEQRDPAVLEPLDEVDLPERAVGVEPARHDARGQLAQLVERAGAGQCGAAYVVGEVEVLVVDPDRVGQAAGDAAYVLAVAGHERDPVVDVRQQRVVVEAGVTGVEDLERRVVHRRLRRLLGQQREVARAQPLAHSPNPSRRGV